MNDAGTMETASTTGTTPQIPKEKWAKSLWEKEIGPRLELIKLAQGALPQGLPLTDDSRFSLAATEVFVQRAQTILTRRATANYCFAAISLGLSLYALYDLVNELKGKIPSFEDGYVYAAYILRALTTTASYFVGVTILFSFAKAFITSANELLDRRHALRFGKLVIYHGHNKPIDVKEMEQIFQWNKDGNGDYIDLKSASIKSPVGQLTSIIQKLVEKIPSVGSKPTST